MVSPCFTAASFTAVGFTMFHCCWFHSWWFHCWWFHSLGPNDGWRQVLQWFGYHRYRSPGFQPNSSMKNITTDEWFNLIILFISRDIVSTDTQVINNTWDSWFWTPRHWWPEELELVSLEQPCTSNWHQMELNCNCCLFRTWHCHWLFQDEIWAQDQVSVQVTLNLNPNAISFLGPNGFHAKAVADSVALPP